MDEENSKGTESQAQDKKPKASPSQNFLEGDEENFMTLSPKEKAAWVKMMKARHAALVKKEQESKKRQENLLQRRLEIYNRSRNLLNVQRDRFRFLLKVSEVVKTLSENQPNSDPPVQNNEDNDMAIQENKENTQVEGNVSDGTNPSIKDQEENANEQTSNVKGDNQVPTIVEKEPTNE